MLKAESCLGQEDRFLSLVTRTAQRWLLKIESNVEMAQFEGREHVASLF